MSRTPIAALRPAEPLVAVEGLVHIYKTAELEVVALQGLDLLVAEGETVAVVGRSGSGKTTHMNILAGVETPSAGSAVVAGQDLARLDGRQRERYRRETVGYLWQRSAVNLWPELTAAQNLQVPMLAAGGPEPERVRSLLEAFGLWTHRERRPDQFSGGEAQRLALAVALANRPRLLLADEPTAELDGDTARTLLADLVALLRESGTGAILVTHDPQLELFSDRTLQIRDGRTSTERRYVERGGGMVADELVILDRAGRLQLPRHLVEELGLGDRVRVHREGEALVVTRLGAVAADG
ncbi:MAG: ABC transporter ATP-binding protein [Candidatus Dormibacteraeota bacterium]|nr:ABC transporter ATP-binding protein [Candidatus Dormibacteraeota bacterium]